MFFSKLLQTIKIINSKKNIYTNVSKLSNTQPYFYYKIIQNKQIPELIKSKKIKLKSITPIRTNVEYKKNYKIQNNNTRIIPLLFNNTKIENTNNTNKISKSSIHYLILTSGVIFVITTFTYGYTLLTNIIVLF